MDTVPKGQGPQGSSCIVVGLFGEEVWVSSFFFSFFEKRKWEVRRPSQIPHNVYDRRCLNSYTLAAFFFFFRKKTVTQRGLFYSVSRHSSNFQKKKKKKKTILYTYIAKRHEVFINILSRGEIVILFLLFYDYLFCCCEYFCIILALLFPPLKFMTSTW